MVDANGAYGRTHIPHICSWDHFGLMMIEQPLPGMTWKDMRCSAGSAPRDLLDESVESLRQSKRRSPAAARIINIKLQRLGSVGAALRVHDLCSRAEIGCWMGTMPELGVGAYAAMHVATLPNIRYPTDVESSDRWFVAEVTEPAVQCATDCWPCRAPGTRRHLECGVIARYKVRECPPAFLRLRIDLP